MSTQKSQKVEPNENERWWTAWEERVEDADGADARLALAREALAEAPEPEHVFLQDLFGSILDELDRAKRHADRIALIEQLEARFPNACAAEPHAFARARFESALELEGADLVEEARRMAPHVAASLGLVVATPSRLAWEGKIAALRALTEGGWPGVRDREGLFDWAVAEWVGFAIGAVLLEHLERDPDLREDDAALNAALSPFRTERFDLFEGYVRRWLRCLAPAPDLRADGVVIDRLGRKNAKDAEEHVANAVAICAGRLRAERGWTRGKVWVLLGALPGLLVSCAEGAGKKDVRSLLLPPASRFVDRLFERSTSELTQNLWEIEAVTEAAPAWAEEIARRGWATAKAADDWQREVTEALAKQRPAFE